MMLIWLNFAFLLCIELQPVFNTLRATYPSSQTTGILYASDQAVTGLMILVIFILSIAVIVFHNDYAIYIWLLVIILEVVDLLYWRVRYGSYKRQESLS